MSNIVTFYSYKGGVGRSMALANIAYELSKKNKKVLMVDWDLEAPGLERYFAGFKIDNAGKGLFPLLLEYNQGNVPDYKEFIWNIHLSSEFPLHLLHSGREQNPEKYSAELEKFNWNNFFQVNNGGLHLENLRNQWLKDYDIVLIDSRTGLSDASGICTIMLPDIIIPMFTANYQSLFGIRDIMKLIQSARQKLDIDRMNLTILPVPSRFGTRVEFKESQEWLDRIADILKDCFSDWLPKWIEPRYMLEQVKIPQVDYFSFGEKLAVVEQGTNDPEGMGFIYSKLANLLATGFLDVKSFVGLEYYEEKRRIYETNKSNLNPIELADRDFSYDLYVIYPRKAYSWLRELLLPALTEFLEDELGYAPKVFVEFNEVTNSEARFYAIQNAIKNSKKLLLICSADELNSEFFYEDVFYKSVIGLKRDQKFIFPILYTDTTDDFLKDNFNMDLVTEMPWVYDITDLRSFNIENTINSTRLTTLFGKKIENLATKIADSLSPVKAEESKPLRDYHLFDDRALREIKELAINYEDLRKQMESGNARTILLENVFAEMKLMAHEVRIYLPDLMRSKSAGQRLAAIAVLHEMPDLEYLSWMAERVGDAEKPFVGYQAAVGIFITAKAFRNDHKPFIEKIINRVIAKLEKSRYKDPNQEVVLNWAKTELDVN